MSEYSTLLTETKEFLRQHDKTIDDIIAIGGNDFRIPIEDFLKLADKGYDSGFGAQEVAADLILLGKDFWLERHEYDGSEWWEYKELPGRILNLPVNKNVRSLFGSWDTLQEIEERCKKQDEQRQRILRRLQERL